MKSPRFLARAALAFAAVLSLAGSARGDARFSAPQRGEVLAAGETVELRWTSRCPDANGASETELLLSLDGGITFPVRVTPEMTTCARGFRWQVPALETAHARLALRVGSGEDSENERLDIVSDEFAIVAAEDKGEGLVQGAREWWTRQALDGDGTEDLPSESVADAAERLVAPDCAPDINEPPAPGVGVPRFSAAALPESLVRSIQISPRPASPSAGTPLPLRL